MITMIGKQPMEPAMMQTAAGFPLIEDIPTAFVFQKWEKALLQALAHDVAEIAASEENEAKAAKWQQLNDLKRTEPVVFADPENGWNEIIPASGLQCRDPLARLWEMYLKKLLYWANDIKDDKMIETYFDVPICYSTTGWGLEIKKEGGEGGGAYHIVPPIREYEEDFHRLKFPEIILDHDASARLFELAQDVFGSILQVRHKTTWWWTLGMTWDFINLRGLEEFMMDMLLEPEWVHDMMAFLTDGYLKRLDFLQENGLLSVNTEGAYIGSGGFGATSELPRPADITRPVTTMDMWGFCESQETVGVGPEMFAEFILPYQTRILDRFGLNCYGCCEPIDRRWQYVKQLPRLRRVSASPWSDKRMLAEQLGRDYVISVKPSPTPLASPVMNEAEVRSELRQILVDTKGCAIDLIMKDNHTLGNNPRNITRWVEIAREEIDRIVG